MNDYCKNLVEKLSGFLMLMLGTCHSGMVPMTWRVDPTSILHHVFRMTELRRLILPKTLPCLGVNTNMGSRVFSVGPKCELTASQLVIFNFRRGVYVLRRLAEYTTVGVVSLWIVCHWSSNHSLLQNSWHTHGLNFLRKLTARLDFNTVTSRGFCLARWTARLHRTRDYLSNRI